MTLEMQIFTFNIVCNLFVLLISKSQASMNIALLKNARQSSNLKENVYHAHLAVDGDHSRDRDKCTHTAAFVQPREAWWQVDLGSTSEIQFVKIYYDPQTGYRFNGFQLYLSQTLEPWRNESPCYKDNEPGNPPPELRINCTGYGKYVTVFSNETYSANEPIVELCEVEVYGCSSGMYGPFCNETCPSTCLNDRCNPDDGHCKECRLGTYGTNCTNYCHCLKGSCDIVSGICKMPVCKDGWKGNMCNEPCSVQYFGVNCSRKCNCENEGCNHVNGKCDESGCKQGWKGVSCSEPCEQNQFGRDCIYKCHCNIGSCDSVNGKCNISGCQAGWYGENCSLECADNKYGPDCIYTCNCLNGRCDFKTGICPEGCQQGWTGKHCNERCSKGTFGYGCMDQCHCKTGGCNHIHGICEVQECLNGWQCESCSKRVADNDCKCFVYAVIGGIIGLLLATMVFLILISMFFWRRRSKSKSKKRKVYEHTHDLEIKDEGAYDELQEHGLQHYVNAAMPAETPESENNVQL